VFGIEKLVYLDRMDQPTPLFYTEGPFVNIDFRSEVEDRVPSVSSDEPLILITKKGRYEKVIIGYTKTSKIVKEDGDWVLWYVPPEVGIFELPVVSK